MGASSSSASVHESYEFLPFGGESLFVGWYLPAGPPAALVLLVSPIHEEKKAAHRPLVDLARALAGRGVACVRFDYRGSGDSTGDPAGLTLTSMREDTLRVVEAARERLGALDLTLVGLRLGADVTALVAEQLEGLRRLVLVTPVGKGSRYLSQARLRSKIRGALTGPSSGSADADAEGFDFDGHYVSPKAIEELESYDLATRESPLACRVVCLDICAREKPTAAMESLAVSLGARTDDSSLSAVVGEPFWNALGPVEPCAFIAAVVDEIAPNDVR
jgi:pimeloyl-ACP methyl ester carboxylesterase